MPAAPQRPARSRGAGGPGALVQEREAPPALGVQEAEGRSHGGSVLSWRHCCELQPH